jgi:DNA polymerase
MVESMFLVDAHGYSIVLTVHDEIVSEDDEDFGSQTEFENLMSTIPSWASGCPVGVDGWVGVRYRK